MRSNEAALALYEPYGFIDHHDYRYLEPAPAQDPHSAGTRNPQP